ncbi:hypothetical protein LPJ75_006335 [Coemansia sp. RSA 2598]|nr:hypothetical protein LPJ75_006335 [Coemansia sp. RSA 2598]
MQEIPHEIRLSRADDNSNMPVLIDVASLVAAATQMHMDNSHQRDMESVVAPRPTANIEDVLNNGAQKKQNQMPLSPSQPKANVPADGHRQPMAAPAAAPDGSVVKQGIQGKITVPAREIHGMAGPASVASAPASGLAADKKPGSARPAAASTTAADEDVDVDASRETAVPHTTRTVIAHERKTTTVAAADADADADAEDGENGKSRSVSHNKKKDDKIIASIKSGGMDRFAGDESGAMPSSRYCSAALAAFVIVAASYL